MGIQWPPFLHTAAGSSWEQRHFRDFLCTLAHNHQEQRQDGEGARGLPQLVFCPFQPKTAKNNDKPKKATSSKPGRVAALLGSVLHRCLFCSLTASPHWSTVPQAATPFQLLLSAQLGWTGLSSAPVGWALSSWTGSQPHQPIPHWCCHPTPIDLRFAAFLSAPHPPTALWRKA